MNEEEKRDVQRQEGAEPSLSYTTDTQPAPHRKRQRPGYGHVACHLTEHSNTF